MSRVVGFFDKLEDTLRSRLSRYPVLYTFIGGVGIVLFWRGVWMTADMVPFLTGPVSIVVSVGILLVTGLFVSFFIHDDIIRSGLKEEKKLVEKTKFEVEQEMDMIAHIDEHLEHLEADVKKIKRTRTQRPARKSRV